MRVGITLDVFAEKLSTERQVTTMSTATIHGMTVPLDAFGRPSEPFATQADMEARASLSAALRCAHSGKLDNALDHARDAYDNEDAPIELRLEAASSASTGTRPWERTGNAARWPRTLPAWVPATWSAITL